MNVTPFVGRNSQIICRIPIALVTAKNDRPAVNHRNALTFFEPGAAPAPGVEAAIMITGVVANRTTKLPIAFLARRVDDECVLTPHDPFRLAEGVPTAVSTALGGAAITAPSAPIRTDPAAKPGRIYVRRSQPTIVAGIDDIDDIDPAIIEYFFRAPAEWRS